MGRGARLREGQMKELHCRDLGFECDAVVNAANDEEVLAKVAAHAKAVHDFSDEQLADPSLHEQVRARTRQL